MVNDTITKNVYKYAYESTVNDTESSAPANSEPDSSDSSSVT